jgi:hypothetical protein
MTERVLPAPAALVLSKPVRASDTVIWGQAGAGPLTLAGALGAQQHAVGPVQCFPGIGADGGCGSGRPRAWASWRTAAAGPPGAVRPGDDVVGGGQGMAAVFERL